MAFTDVILVIFALASSLFSLAIIAHVHRCLELKDKFKFVLIISGIAFNFFLLGELISNLIYSKWELNNNWILVVLLSILGIRYIFKAYRSKPENRFFDFTSMKVLFATSIAASMDFLIFGLCMPFLNNERQNVLLLLLIFILLAVIIGLGTGRKLRKFVIGNYLLFLGGILLIGMAVKTSLHILNII